MKIIRWVKYLAYIISIYLLLMLRGYVGFLAKQKFQSSYQLDYLYLLPSALIGIVIGLVLGLDHLFRERRKIGKWRFNWPKLILIGLPSFLVALYPITYGNPVLARMIMKLVFSLRDTSGILLFQVLFGYILMTSPYKKGDSPDELPR